MADIFQDPVKIIMVIILLAMVIPAAIALAIGWKKACKECREQTDMEQIPCAEDPCERCLRWSECNGVDEMCPVRTPDIK